MIVNHPLFPSGPDRPWDRVLNPGKARTALRPRPKNPPYSWDTSETAPTVGSCLPSFLRLLRLRLS